MFDAAYCAVSIRATERKANGLMKGQNIAKVNHQKLTNLTKKEGYMENGFTVTFGQLPSSCINREHVSEK